MLQIIALLYLAIGIILLITVALKPRLFWTALIVAAVGAGGLMALGNTFVDEYLIGSILLGQFIAVFIGAVHLHKEKENIWEFLHKWAFFILILYMIVQCWRGVLFFEDLGKVRWIVFYGMLGVIALLISYRGFPIPTWRKMAFIVSSTVLAYLILYLSHGLFTEIVRGISRYSVQPGEWSTTAYALFPLVIGIPSALFLVKDKSSLYRWIGWITLITAMIAAFYYESRVSWLVIFAFLFMAIFQLGIRKTALIALSLCIVFSLCFGISSREGFMERASGFSGELLRTAQSIRFWDDSVKTDIDRKVHLQAGFVSITENWHSFLFGHGFRTSGLVISPHLKNLYIDKGRPDLASRVADDAGTEGFTAFLVEAGVLGMVLLGLNFLFVFRRIMFQKKNPNKKILLLSLLFTFLWLPVINIIDIMLFYLLIMPRGLLLQLSRYPVTIEQAVKEKLT